jgi:hypothetical protein
VSSPREQRIKELSAAAAVTRDYIQMHADGQGNTLAWTRPELETMLSDICGEAEALTDANAGQGTRWLPTQQAEADRPKPESEAEP